VIAAFTTSRKATVGGLITFLSPLYVLLQSGEDITWRAVLASVVAGVLGFLGVWAPSNSEPYEPRHLQEDV
jgi:drug/metabolite transporter (DMT)-like permease